MTRRRIVLGLVVGVVLAAGAAGYWWYRPGPPQPPEVDTTGYDPEVLAAVAGAMQAVRQEPGSAAAWGKLGLRLLAHGFHAEAQICLARAGQLEPDNPRWVYLEGRLIQLGDPEAALPLLRRAAGLARTTSMPRLHLAETLLSLGHLDEAEAEFQRVLKNEPNHPRANAGLGRLTYRRGDLDASLKLLNLSAPHRHSCGPRTPYWPRSTSAAATARPRSWSWSFSHKAGISIGPIRTWPRWTSSGPAAPAAPTWRSS